MKITELSGKLTTFVITETEIGDPITVIMRDIQPGKGELILSVWGRAWSVYWGAMGDGWTLRDFLLSTSVEYVANKLIPRDVVTSTRAVARERKYLELIAADVKKAMQLMTSVP